MDLKEVQEIGYLDFSDIKIAVVGDCMLDIYYYGTVDRISPEAPVPIFKANNAEPEFRLGGACNTALNLAKLGVQTSLFGFVGKDIGASYIETYLSENNIDSHLFKLSNFPTITKNRYFANNQQIIRIDQEDTNDNLYNKKNKDKLILSLTNREDYYHAIIISDYGKGALSGLTLNTILTECKQPPIFVDPKITDWGHYEGAFCITPNWKEFKNACHVPNLKFHLGEVAKYAMDQCLKHNIEHILITLGSDGMVLINKNTDVIVQPAKAAEIYDVSGAGDTVIATIAAAYCKSLSMSICMQLATMASKVVIGKLGTYAITNSELQVELLNAYTGKDNYSGDV